MTNANLTNTNLSPTTPNCRQVETGGDSLSCMAISSSGETLALGGSGGYIHLWTDQPEVPTVNRFPEELEVRPYPPDDRVRDAEPHQPLMALYRRGVDIPLF